MKITTKQIFKIKLQKGDMVVITKGRLKGQKGRITETHPRLNKVTVENLNLVKKHLKPTKMHPQGGILEVTRPIWVSKVSLIEPKSQKPSRVGFKLNKDAQKERIYKKSGEVVARPGKKQS